MGSYRTVEKTAVCEFVERRSRFIGAVSPVKTEEEAIEFIAARRKVFWDAAHNVYAYVLREGQVRRYSDDGEPQGTAGLPVLNVLAYEELFDCVLVVTRYFGGVLLGTGGLVRAYAHSAKLAVNQAAVVTMRMCVRALIRCDYNQYGRVAALVPEAGGSVLDTRFTDCVEIEFLLPCGFTDMMQAKLTELSAGSLTIQVIGEEFASFKN